MEPEDKCLFSIESFSIRMVQGIGCICMYLKNRSMKSKVNYMGWVNSCKAYK